MLQAGAKSALCVLPMQFTLPAAVISEIHVSFMPGLRPWAAQDVSKSR